MSALGTDLIRHALTTARAKGYRQVRVRSGSDVFSAVLSDDVEAEVYESPIEVVNGEVAAAPTERAVASPVVGFFRASEPAVEAGARLNEGDPIGSVVALGISNEVVASEPCEVAEVCVQDGDPVEYGQSIVLVRK